MLKALSTATLAALFALSATALAQSTSQGVGGSGAIGPSSSGTRGPTVSPSQPSTSLPSPSSAPATLSTQCDMLTGLEKERCLRERAGAPAGSATSPGTGSTIGNNAPGTGSTGTTGSSK
jgi:hypothetical protein